ncbi:DegT/DnrJ/EryC1/StrS aminotransferase family protein [Rhodonellum sp.]|uniref:DegT/DnrJ/EryC1/StrS family aminotransferase n=1 Tax=Rhodonellum sp. TaxID=2231180 RepID=UPI00271A2596|nr:DegT/DnrJ/EryC1/StrS family aminotransferase [Rhodonellum sp.]MDO9551120.1 DegT/DnrJ/EryC1/StrS family aminotransferase [Rhodonellum sp.]
MIPVTKPFLPDKADYQKLVDQIWKRNWLTNNGPLVNDLELKLKETLGLEHLLFTTNGTIAIQMAIKALGLKGEIITTPFSYVATTSSIVWENCTPIFADIDPERFTIDPRKIEELITSNTTAILATHVYGIPCHIEEIEAIAKKHNLKVIYDAAHAFGTTYKGKSLLSYGDISTLSTHATKLFHTIEGGAVMANDPEVLKTLAYMRNFGHNGPEEFYGLGINGKNSEFHAAMGLVNLKHLESILEKRRTDSLHYDHWLKGRDIQRPVVPQGTNYNHAYYPVLFESKEIAMKVFKALEMHEIFARRYFYPSLSALPYLTKQETPVCDDIAARVLCLPLYFDLSQEEIDLICRLIIRTLKY